MVIQPEEEEDDGKKKSEKRHIPKSSITAATVHSYRTGLRKLFLAIKVI